MDFITLILILCLSWTIMPCSYSSHNATGHVNRNMLLWIQWVRCGLQFKQSFFVCFLTFWKIGTINVWWITFCSVCSVPMDVKTRLSYNEHLFLSLSLFFKWWTLEIMTSSEGLSHTESKNVRIMSVCSDLTKLCLRDAVQFFTPIAGIGCKGFQSAFVASMSCVTQSLLQLLNTLVAKL